MLEDPFICGLSRLCSRPAHRMKMLTCAQYLPLSRRYLLQATLEANPRNSVIGFHDNSSALRGGPVTPTLPLVPGAPSALAPQKRDWDVLLTAETHNFPCAVAPYPGE